tara:strand:- start:15512 stop:15997 length:486 start_codon:yes stop_codon:yes gene_type:complete
MTKQDFKALLWRAGFHRTGKLDRKAAMAFLHIKSERTLERWLAGAEPCPRAVAMLEQRIAGYIPQSGAWNGFSICRNGKLWTPRGHSYDASYINKLDFIVRASRIYESQVVNLKAEIAALEKLVDTRERLKEMGHELVEMSDKLRLEAMIRVFKDIERERA